MVNCFISRLPEEVLEKIFGYLDFGSLIRSEMTCRLWRKIINERRLFWQLSKNIAKSEVIKRKRRAKVTEKVDLSKAARDIRRQANKFKRKRLI